MTVFWIAYHAKELNNAINDNDIRSKTELKLQDTDLMGSKKLTVFLLMWFYFHDLLYFLAEIYAKYRHD